MRSLVKIPLSSLFLVLAACGGGGATGSGTPAPVSPVEPPPATSQTGLYTSQAVNTTQAGALATLDALGEQGRAWVSDLAIPSGPNGIVISRSLFVRNESTPTRYRYVMEPAGLLDASDWVARANGHGSLSRLYKGTFQYTGSGGAAEAHDVYVERVDKTARFSWLASALPASVDAVNLLALIDAQGRNGHAWRGFRQFGATAHALFVRDDTRPGPFSYRLPAAPATLAALTDQLTAQASAGCRYLGPLQIGSAYSVFQCETNDPYPVSASARLSVARSGEAALLAALNAEAAAGQFYLGDLMLGSGAASPVAVSVFSGGSQPAHPLSGPVWP